MDFITLVVSITAAAFVIGAGAMLALAIGWFIDSWRGLVRRFQRPATEVVVRSVHDLPPPSPAMTTADMPTVVLRRDELDLARAMRVLDEDGISR